MPDWYEALDRLVAVGQLSMASMADAQYRASQAAVLDQELAGIDVVTGGEMHRRTHNRHSPPNAMLNYFWQKIPAFQGSTRPKPITPHDPDVFHPAATCRGRIADNIDLGLVDEFKMVSALTRKPVKITMTGPHMLAKVAYDEHYNDIAEDDGRSRQAAAPQFQDAGRRRLQAHPDRRAAVHHVRRRRGAAAVDAINLAIEDLPDDVHVSMHICQGNYAVGKEYDGQIGHRYFDIGRYKADLVCKIECSSYLIEHDMTHHYEGLLGNQQLGVGAVDVQDPKVESGETVVAARIQPTQMAGARADHRHQLVRLQSSAARTAFGKLQGDGRGQAHARRLRAAGGAVSPGDDKLRPRPADRSSELLALAQEAGRLGVFEWQVQAGHRARLSPERPSRSMA